MRVLIAEDDPTSCEVLQLNLKAWGYEVLACTDGIQAWNALSQPGAPRLALLDWMMPGLSGVEVCQQLRAQEQKQPIYIIMLTARSQRQDVIEGLEAGADDYVVKPFDRHELRARVRVGARMVKLQEKLMQAEQTRVLAQTAGAAAHEINQPLTVLLGKLELILFQNGQDHPLSDELTQMLEAGKRIEAIVTRMSAARRYVTKPYIRGVDIIDFDASADNEA